MSFDSLKASPQDSSVIGRWAWDFSQDAMEWDEAMHSIFGLTPGTFEGSSDDFLNRVHDGDRAHVANAMAGVIECGNRYDGEFRIVWPCDGSIHLVVMTGIMHREESGKPLGMIGECQFSSNENSSGLTASMERTMFAALMDHLPDCIYFKDMNSRMIVASQANARWFGLPSPKALIGKTDFDLFTDEHAIQAMEDERHILDTGEPLINLEEKETWPDGHATYVSTSKMPLRDERGRIIGTFGLSRDITERKHAEEQLAAFAEELRRKNEALEEELAMARELQLTMLPQSFPSFIRDGQEIVRFHHFFQPSAAVSGDFFDVYQIAEDRVGIFICDVMGHGVRASLVAATARALVEEMTAKKMSPEELLSGLNTALRRMLRHNSTPLFVTACYLVADLSTGELTFATAGHPKPILVRADYSGPLEGKSGPVLGLFDDPVYERCTAQLCPHDIILAFTDGLFEVESASGEIYDYSRLLGTIENRRALPMKELCHGIIEEVQQFSASREFSDDACLVGMEWM